MGKGLFLPVEARGFFLATEAPKKLRGHQPSKKSGYLIVLEEACPPLLL
jgi:hypothetical protein